MDQARSNKHERATAIVTHVVEPGREAEFEAWERGIMGAANAFPGHQGTEVIRTAHGPKPEYVIIMHFDTQKNLEHWENSAERADWLARGEQLVRQDIPLQPVTGLEYWFTLPDHAGTLPPRRYKMAFVTWLAISPLVQVVLPFINQALGYATLPSVINTWIATGVITILMTWVVMPLMTRLFARWLYQDKESE